MNTGKLVLIIAVSIAAVMIGHRGWLEWQLSKPGFHERDCWFEQTVVGKSRCGFMVVQENRQNPDSRTIRLPVVIFGAEKHVPQREPILYLTGGPGGSAALGEQDTIEGWWSLRRSFPKGHDLIVLAQRGTGLEEPELDCPELRGIEISLGARPPGAPPLDTRALSTQGAIDCSTRLLSEGVDLTAYNSRQSAADIAELRLALGLEEWTLYGISYGTRLALSTLRYHPEGVRSVVLDSVFPPEATWNLDTGTNVRQALQRVFTSCAADPGCARQYGDLEEAYRRANERLSAEPPSFSLLELFGERDRVFTIGGQRINYSPRKLSEKKNLVITVDPPLFNSMLFDALLTKETRDLIPVVLREAATSDSTVLRARLRDYLLGPSGGDIAIAVFLSHICRDETPFESAAALAAAAQKAGPLGTLISESLTSYLCEVWPAGAAEPEENTPVRSAVPALLLAGSYDPLTPPALAWSTVAHLPNGYVFELAESSHHVLYDDDCAESLVADFLADPSQQPEGRCPIREITNPAGD